MKILVNSINHSPDLTGIGKYTGEMVKWLVDQGHEVRVVTAPPYYPQWRVLSGYSSLLYKLERLNGARVIRCPLWVPKSPSGLKRVFHLASFAATALPIMLWYGLFWRPNIVFVVEPPLACAPGALIAGWLSGARTWLHIQDFEIDAAFDLGMLRSPRLRQWISAAESWLMRRFKCVSTISVRMVDRLLVKGVAEDRILLFENWVETNRIFPLPDRPALHAELGLPEGRKIILYSGNMGQKQGLELVIEAAAQLADRQDLLFLLCGTGAARSQLEAMASGLENVCFLSLQPLEKLNDLLNLAYLHLLPQRSGAEDLVMPSKLTNMMASGRPVVATAAASTQISNVLDGCGIVVAPDDLDGFCVGIVELVDNPVKTDQMGKRGREYVETHWDTDQILSRVFDKIIKL